MSFEDLGLSPGLRRALAERAYTEATPIQRAAIPAVLAGRDVLAGAQTGTGKTAAFVLPLLERLGSPAGTAPRALVLAPTRELAAQVAESALAYGRYSGVRVAVVFGGVNINPQIERLRSGCDLLVATPGRLLDLLGQRAARLDAVRHFVLDEADRMLDMGFIRDIRRVIAQLPARRQNLMFSATYSAEIRELAESLLVDPLALQVTPRNTPVERIEQHVYRVPQADKRHLLAHLITAERWEQVLVFTRTKHGANRLTQHLQSSGIAAAAIHGNKSQSARVRALADFKESRITALVATEVAARGLDIKELPQVVNFELPNVPEDYIHRIGRTARAGATGRAVSLVSPDESDLLRDVERLLRQPLPVLKAPAYPVTAAAVPRHTTPAGAQAARTPTGAQPARTHGGARPAGMPASGRPARFAPRSRRRA